MTTQQQTAYESVATCAEQHGLVDLADAIRDMASTDDTPVIDNVALYNRRHEENARQ